MVGQTNNPNAGKPWQRALQRVLAERHGSVDAGLRKLANVVCEAAEGGCRDSLKEISERMDGKTTQMLGSDAEAPLTLVISQQDAKL